VVFFPPWLRGAAGGVCPVKTPVSRVPNVGDLCSVAHGSRCGTVFYLKWEVETILVISKAFLDPKGNRG